MVRIAREHRRCYYRRRGQCRAKKQQPAITTNSPNGRNGCRRPFPPCNLGSAPRRVLRGWCSRGNAVRPLEKIMGDTRNCNSHAGPGLLKLVIHTVRDHACPLGGRAGGRQTETAKSGANTTSHLSRDTNNSRSNCKVRHPNTMPNLVLHCCCVRRRTPHSHNPIRPMENLNQASPAERYLALLPAAQTSETRTTKPATSWRQDTPNPRKTAAHASFSLPQPHT